MQRLLRRIPILRKAALHHALDVRRKRQDAAWGETQSVLIALGNISIGWAGINLVLNYFLENYTLHDGPMAKDEIPRSFEGKLDYMKKIERDPRCGPLYLAESKAIRQQLARMNKRRVSLVHGLIGRKGYGPNWVVHIAKEDGKQLRRWKEHYTAQDVHDFAAEISAMGDRVTRLFPPMPKTQP